MPVAAFVCDADGVIQGFNRRAVELWGREPQRGVERYCGSLKLYLMDGSFLAHARSPIVEVMRTGVSATNVQVFIERPDGSRVAVIATFSALRDAHDQIVGAITCFDDITAHVMSERRLAERIVLDRARSDWLRALINAQEDERRKMARELHDEMGQHPASAQHGRAVVCGAALVRVVSSLPLAGRSRGAALPRRMDRGLCGVPGVQRGPVLHVAPSILSGVRLSMDTVTSQSPGRPPGSAGP